MSLCLGFDQSITQTGWCLFTFPGNERLMKCGSFSAKHGRDAEEQCDIFGREIKAIIGRHKDALRTDGLIVWERAKRQISGYEKHDNPDDMLPAEPDRKPRFTVNATQLLLPEIQGMLRAAAIFYRIPYESVPPRTWRAAILGDGNMDRPTAKAAAKAYCRMLGIKAANENEAEAACITRWGATCSQVFKLAKHARAA